MKNKNSNSNNSNTLAMHDLNGLPLNYYENIFDAVLASMIRLFNLRLQSFFRRVTYQLLMKME